VLSGVVVVAAPAADARSADSAPTVRQGNPVAINLRGTLPNLPGSTAARGARSTSILGTAWGADNTPIPYARLRLRNVLSGKVAATTTANELGQFAFHDVESGSYLVELVAENGRILAIGHTFSVAPGETVATFVRLGTKVHWFIGFFGNAAAAISSTAAAIGITAVSPEAIPCISNCG